MAVSAVKAEPAAAEEAPRPAGKKGLIKLILIAILVIGAAGGGYWYYSHKGHEPAQEAKQEPAKPPVFLPLETFTVNLQLVDNPQFLQTAITLKVVNNAAVDEIKLRMPEVRDRILMLMSSRKAAELLTVDGKRRLGEDIVASMNDVLNGVAGKPKAAEKAADAKDAKGANAKAADEEPDAKDAEDAKDTAGGEAPAEGAERRVQAVLFTSFIIQ
jgi:flagellar FliL protein